MSADEVPAGEIRLFDSQWTNIVNRETTIEGAVKAAEEAMRKNFIDGAFPPPRAFFTKTITDLQSSLAAKDETIAGLRSVLTELVAMVRGECASLLDEDRGGDSRLSLAIDDALAAQPVARRKEEG